MWIRYPDFRFNFTTLGALVHLLIYQQQTTHNTEEDKTKLVLDLDAQMWNRKMEEKKQKFIKKLP